MYYLLKNMYDSPPQESLYLWREYKNGLFLKLGKRWHKATEDTMEDHLKNKDYTKHHLIVAQCKSLPKMLKIKEMLLKI